MRRTLTLRELHRLQALDIDGCRSAPSAFMLVEMADVGLIVVRASNASDRSVRKS